LWRVSFAAAGPRRIIPAAASGARLNDVNIRMGTVDPDRLLFATHPVRQGPIIGPRERLREAGEIESAAALFRSHPDYRAPERIVPAIVELVASGRYRLLDA
jgi:hypothetical protein